MDKELEYQLYKDMKAFNRMMKRDNKHLNRLFSWYEDREQEVLEDGFWQDVDGVATPQDEFDT